MGACMYTYIYIERVYSEDPAYDIPTLLLAAVVYLPGLWIGFLRLYSSWNGNSNRLDPIVAFPKP